MNIIFYSDRKIDSFHKNLGKSKKYSITVLPYSEIKKTLKKNPENSLVYIDITGKANEEKTKILKYMSGLGNSHWGIINCNSDMADISEIFHKGGSDYINAMDFKNGLTAKRINRIINFREIDSEPATFSQRKYTLIPSGSNWEGIKEGSEYTFLLMFIELDNLTEIRKKMSETQIHHIAKGFEKFISRTLSSQNGKIWMWGDFGGIVLFPFNGESCPEVLTCFRLVLNNKIICAEDLNFGLHLSYRIILHIGNTKYRERGDTGTLIADSINSIFHIANYHATPGNFYLTDTVREFIPAGLERCFMEEGIFEEREIIKMRNFR